MSFVHICFLLLQKEVKIIRYSLVTEANTVKQPVNEGSIIQSVLTEWRPFCCYCYLWNRRGLTMPARTLGSWEEMTSDIISGNSTFIESAWMKVLRQNRLIFFTICHTREIASLCLYSTQPQLDLNMIQACDDAYIVHGVH